MPQLAQVIEPSPGLPWGALGEDWSQTHSDHALIDHVRSRVNDYLSIGCINRVQQECHDLARLYPQAR